eukprot:jgi/Picsp_1/1985/NSC_05451-R1_tho complex 3
MYEMDIEEDPNVIQKWRKTEIRSAHRRKIFCLDWNCSGSYLASGSQDQGIKLWKIGTKNISISLESELKGHSDSVMFLRWHPTDQNKLVSTSGLEQSLRFWDARSSKNTATLSTPGQNLYLCWSPDGNYVVVGNREDVVCTVDVRKMQISKKTSFKYQVNELAFLDNHLLQGTGHENKLEILNFDTMEAVNSLSGHTGSVLSVSVDPHGKYIATGGADAITCLWDTEGMTCLRSYYHMENPIRALSFSHDSKYLSMTGEDPCVYVEDVEWGSSLGCINLQSSPEESSWNPCHPILAYPAELSDQSIIELRTPPDIKT